MGRLQTYFAPNLLYIDRIAVDPTTPQSKVAAKDFYPINAWLAGNVGTCFTGRPAFDGFAIFEKSTFRNLWEIDVEGDATI